MVLDRLHHWYPQYVRWVSLLQHPFLLACRIYWGASFVQAGFGKLTHLSLYAERFANWHIPAPQFNAVMAGITECICGSLLILGAGSRVITVPLIVTMIVAYRTAHINEVTDLYSFVNCAAISQFINLHTGAAVRSRRLSVDYLAGRFFPSADSEPKVKIPQR